MLVKVLFVIMKHMHVDFKKKIACSSIRKCKVNAEKELVEEIMVVVFFVVIKHLLLDNESWISNRYKYIMKTEPVEKRVREALYARMTHLFIKKSRQFNYFFSELTRA